jgi:flagellar hook protein FlgE
MGTFYDAIKLSYKGGESMVFSVNSSQSALIAYGKRMGVHANNVANAQSEGFKGSRAILREGVNNDVKVEIEPSDSSEYLVSETLGKKTDKNKSNNVDLSNEMVGIKICRRGYETNLKFIKTKDEMAGTILDLLS